MPTLEAGAPETEADKCKRFIAVGADPGTRLFVTPAAYVRGRNRWLDAGRLPRVLLGPGDYRDSQAVTGRPLRSGPQRRQRLGSVSSGGAA